jgi:hypothetical protein
VTENHLHQVAESWTGVSGNQVGACVTCGKSVTRGSILEPWVEHIWDAIAQDGERTRYRRWQSKYFDAIQDFLNKENDAIIDSTD